MAWTRNRFSKPGWSDQALMTRHLLIMGKGSIDAKTAHKTKIPFLKDFLLNKSRLVQIHDEMAMGIKRASEWACWCTLIWSIKQSITKLRARSMCQKFVLSLRQNAITYRWADPFRFDIFFLDSKLKTGIQFSQMSRGNKSLWINSRKKLEEIIRFRQKLLVSCDTKCL